MCYAREVNTDKKTKCMTKNFFFSAQTYFIEAVKAVKVPLF